MISMLLAMARMAGPGDTEIVYSARYYKQGSAKSYYHLYLSRLDGSHRRDLTPGTMDCEAPVWLDRDHVAYVEMPGWFRRVEDIDPAKRFVEIVLLNVKTGDRQVKRRTKFNGRWPGVRVEHNKICINETMFTVSVSGVTEQPAPGYESSLPTGVTQIDRTSSGYRDGSIYQVSNPDIGAEYEVRDTYTSDGIDNPYFEYAITRKGVERRFRAKGAMLFKLYPMPDNKLFVMGVNNWGRGAWPASLYLVDVETGSSTILIDGLGSIEFDPNRSIYFANDDGNHWNMEFLDDGRSVNTNTLSAGNWQTGEVWTVASGLVLTGDYALPPEK